MVQPGAKRRTSAWALSIALVLAGTAVGTSAGQAATNSPVLTVELTATSCTYGMFSPTSDYWVCLANTDTTPGDELYSIPADGSGPPIRLNPVLGTSEDAVTWFEITPDGSTVLFAHGSSAGSDDIENRSLFSVAIDGGSVIALTPWIEPGDLLWLPDLAPDGSRVAFYWYSETEGGLYTMLLDGSDKVVIEPTNDVSFLPTPEEILAPVWDWDLFTPDPSLLFYRSNTGDVYTVPATGGTPAITTGDNVAGGSVEREWFSPDGQYLVYLADHDTLGVPDLYSAAATAGSVVKLSVALQPGEYIWDEVVILPDSSGVIYGVAGGLPGPVVWYLGDPGGGSSTEISDAIYAVPSPDSSLVIMASPEVTAHQLDGGHPVILGEPGAAVVSADAAIVWMWQNAENSGDAHLFTNSVAGGDLQMRPGAILESQDAFLGPDVRMHLSADSRWLLYGADSDRNGTDELWAVSRDGDGAAFRIADDIFLVHSDYGTLSGIAISPDSTRVVYSVGSGTYSTLLTRYPGASDVAWEVSEATAVGTDLGTVTATDPDGDTLTFSLSGADGKLVIDADTGEVALSQALDYETSPQHIAAVDIWDGLVTTSITLAINVTDVDEPPPTTTTTTEPPPPTTTTLPAPDYTDVDDTSLFVGDITWLAQHGITRGCNPPINDRYCPSDYVTRGQMAAFLRRALSGTLTTGPAVEFNDDDQSPFEDDIEWLASVGVTKGCNPPANDQFCPDRYITRDQMAAFLDRALDLPEPERPDLFADDDGSIFEEQIDRIAAAGISRGCNPPANDQFCPNQLVTRQQMAAFLHRALKDY